MSNSFLCLVYSEYCLRQHEEKCKACMNRTNVREPERKRETCPVPFKKPLCLSVLVTVKSSSAAAGENINSEHFPVEDGEARRTLSELDEKGPGGATTAISLSGTLDEEEEEETECTDKDTEAGQCAGTTTESQALKVVVCKLCRISFRNSEFLQRHERTSTQHAKKLPGLFRVDSPGLRSVKACRQDDGLVNLQFGVQVNTVEIPHGGMQSTEGLTGFGDPLGNLVIDSHVARKRAS
ncbi:unnamed protein product [Schistocephalus solidus]|uniref:C2H2-type domain-containing protein n=1 Tax=Schistocephalus solidus TaxID=70667 RepID=A0A183TI64_SCHSO|nr:unnamed protein product [Schistocephalus solidus]